jgi:hypothetical protein
VTDPLVPVKARATPVSILPPAFSGAVNVAGLVAEPTRRLLVDTPEITWLAGSCWRTDEGTVNVPARQVDGESAHVGTVAGAGKRVRTGHEICVNVARKRETAGCGAEAQRVIVVRGLFHGLVGQARSGRPVQSDRARIEGCHCPADDCGTGAALGVSYGARSRICHLYLLL